MTNVAAYQQLQALLKTVYNEREAANIADMVMEHVTGQSKMNRVLSKGNAVTAEQQAELERITEVLLQHQPVQYALGYAWFMGMKLTVNKSVLIPRPETEELVEWILHDIEALGNKEISLLDIGSGSGCIPIAVRKKIPEVAVSAVDISDDALQVAKLNSIEQNVLVDFLHLDFLEEDEWKQLGRYNIIVSNPPYVRKNEQASMQSNVLKHEPHLALFVPDDDAMLFYKAIAKFSRVHLKENGSVYVEINEALSKEVAETFKQQGFEDVEIKKDMQGKDRMVRAGRCKI